ncbi:hypothetical protein CLOM_g3682 [Closterium sp. NIES-68]|nr:hypothetical protein CLOM_g3682 [Closterium sp. NIES-68]
MAPTAPAARPTSARFAYVTLITSPSYVMAALVWCTALRLTGTQQHLVLMTAMDAPLTVPALHEHFDLVLPVPLVPSKYGAKHFAKLQAWRLEQYEKVVFLDVDALALCNLDHLFQRDEPTGAPSYFTEAFNSGMLVLQPSQATFSSLVAKIDVLGSTDYADQGYLNRFWPGFANMSVAHRLPYRYNAMVLYPRNYPPPPWYDVERAHEVLGPLMVVHLGGPWGKPAGMGANRPVHGPNGCHWCFATGQQPYAVWLRLWYNVSLALYDNCWHLLPVGESAASAVGGGGQEGAQGGEEGGEGALGNGFSLTAGLPNAADYEREGPGKEPRAAGWVRGSMTESAVAVAPGGVSGSGGRVAVATVVGEHNQHAAVVWVLSYNKHHPPGPSRLPTLLLVLATVPLAQRQLLAPLFDRVHVVEPLGHPGGDSEQLSVLQVWNETDYERLLYVDALSLFTANCHDAVSAFHPFAAPPLRFPPDMFSTRVMLLQPDRDVLAHMLHELVQRANRFDFLDVFLNAYYGTWFYEAPQHRMPYAYAVNLRYNQRLRQYHPHPRIVTFDGDSPLRMDVRVWEDPTGGPNYGHVWHGYWQDALTRWPLLRSLQAIGGRKR